MVGIWHNFFLLYEKKIKFKKDCYETKDQISWKVDIAVDIAGGCS
jgi:hypothetical protein